MFPTNAELVQRMCNLKIIKWSDLPIDDWYKIESEEKKQTQFGERTIWHLSNRSDEQFSAWVPEMIAKRHSDTFPFANYVQTKGLVKSRQNPSRSYHDFNFASMA